MKKFINVLAVVLALVMCLGIVAACGGKDEGDKEANGTTTAGKTTPSDKVTTPVVTTPEVTTTEEVTTNPEDDDNPVSEGTVPANGVITTAAELHAVLNATDVADKDFQVTATELDMTDRKWVGIKDYKGTFDFGGCKIKGVAYPMFNSVVGGTVKNLVVTDSTQNYTNTEAEADKDLVIQGDKTCFFYGGVIRYMNEGTVENITVESSVTIEASIWENMNSGGEEGKTNARGGFGGVLGFATGSSILVKDCTFKGTITTDSLVVNLGGVVGRVDCGDAASLNQESPEDSLCLVVDCYNYGSVYNIATGNDSKTGGVVGAFGTGAIVRCANYGTVDSTDGGQTAGVFGQTLNQLVAYNCLNVGTVKGASYTGGITAYSNGNVRVFIGCINLGQVSSNGANYGGMIGLVKRNETLTHCYNLNTAVDQWARCKNGAMDPADSATLTSESGTPVVTDCANLATVDEILTAINANYAGVFAKTADGSIDFAK